VRIQDLRVYRSLWRAHSYRRRVGLALLAFFGATASIGQLALWAAGLSGGIAVTVSIAILAPFGIVIAMTSALPPGDVKLRHPNIGSHLRIRIGDLFDSENTSVVITMNRRFDTALEWVAEASLISQLIRRINVDPSVAKQFCKPQFNRDAEAAIGEVVTIRHLNDSYLCLAVTNRSIVSRSTVVIDEIWTALNQLWHYARLHNISQLTVPIIGAGFARAQMGRTLLLTLLLTSYLTASTEMPVCDLEVIVHPADADPELLEFAKSYSDLLGYRIVKSNPITELQVE
jgi:Domain of unknown function (DUF6430)